MGLLFIPYIIFHILNERQWFVVRILRWFMCDVYFGQNRILEENNCTVVSRSHTNGRKAGHGHNNKGADHGHHKRDVNQNLQNKQTYCAGQKHGRLYLFMRIFIIRIDSAETDLPCEEELQRLNFPLLCASLSLL